MGFLSTTSKKQKRKDKETAATLVAYKKKFKEEKPEHYELHSKLSEKDLAQHEWSTGWQGNPWLRREKGINNPELIAGLARKKAASQSGKDPTGLNKMHWDEGVHSVKDWKEGAESDHKHKKSEEAKTEPKKSKTTFETAMNKPKSDPESAVKQARLDATSRIEARASGKHVVSRKSRNTIDDVKGIIKSRSNTRSKLMSMTTPGWGILP